MLLILEEGPILGRRGFFKEDGGKRGGAPSPGLPQPPPSGVWPLTVGFPRAEAWGDTGLSLDLLLQYRWERVVLTGEDEVGEGLRVGEA